MPDVEHTATCDFVQPCLIVSLIHRQRLAAAPAGCFSCIATQPVYGFLAGARRSGAGRKDMPKSAGTLFGLALVAASIGFNIWRYPIVWRMTGPMGAPLAKTTAAPPVAPRPAPAAVEPAGSSAATSAVQPIKLLPPKPEPTTPPLMLAATAAPRPIPGTANRADTMTTAGRRPSAADDLEKPLVPVPSMAAAALPPETSDGVNGVRRLPPVDPNMPTLVGTYPSGPSALSRSIPALGFNERRPPAARPRRVRSAKRSARFDTRAGTPRGVRPPRGEEPRCRHV